jgi:hypothetical protein
MDAIKCRPPPQLPPSPPVTPGERSKSSYSPDSLPPLDHFIHSILSKSRCHVPTFLCTLVYLERLQKRLPSHARGCHTTRHRVFLAVLIVTAKYLNGEPSRESRPQSFPPQSADLWRPRFLPDSSPQNKHWQRYAGFFQLAEITLMERQLLTILKFDLNFTEEELIASLGTLLRPEQHVETAAPVEVEEPALAGPSSLPRTGKMAYAVDADLLERGSSAKRKRQQARPLDSPVSEVEEEEEPVPSRRLSQPDDRTKRLTPEYAREAPIIVAPPRRPPPALGSLSAPVEEEAPAEEAPVDLPTAPPAAFRRPPLRSFLLRSSSDSHPTQPPRVQSWASQTSTSSPSTTYRSSIMSSCSSSSTISSASSGPQTPPTPLEDEPVAKLPLSLANLALAGEAHSHPDKVHLARDSISSAATPSLIHALANQPDLWPLMVSSAVSTKEARGLSTTAQKQRARLMESSDPDRRRGSSLISV